MAITDTSRHRLHQRLDELLGTENAAVLMEHLPPVGWADVATKRDLDQQAAATKHDIESLGSELRAGMAALGSQLRAEVSELGSGLRIEMRDLTHGTERRMLLAMLSGFVTMFAAQVATFVTLH